MRKVVAGNTCSAIVHLFLQKLLPDGSLLAYLDISIAGSHTSLPVRLEGYTRRTLEAPIPDLVSLTVLHDATIP